MMKSLFLKVFVCLLDVVHLLKKIQVHRDYIVKLQFEGDKKITCSEEQVFYNIQDRPISGVKLR